MNHFQAFSQEGMEKMGIIICQDCNATIDYFEDDKVTKLYSCCCECNEKTDEQ
ncbi:GapA-binding peptide SR1P [Siminovitchia fortis]